MADHYSLCLLGVMDRLWFHQIILFSEPSSTILLPENLKQQTPDLITSSLINLPSTTTLSTLSTSTQEFSDEEMSSSSSSGSSPITSELNQVILNDKKEQEQKETKLVNDKERPTRLNLGTNNRARSHSLSPSTTKRLKKNMGVRKVLQKFMSCRSLGELELEEVKGFMDLGFIFKKEQINPRIISVVPGLLRLGLSCQHKQNIDNEDNDDHDIFRDEKQGGEEEEEEEEKGIIRPYLSEAWLIRRPNSPLLNLRLPRVSAAADMKRHLKFWARTVASEIIQQESY